jgi:hypothetical protein
MGRQARTLPSNEGYRRTDVLTRGTSTKATIPNYGVSLLTTDLGTDFLPQDADYEPGYYWRVCARQRGWFDRHYLRLDGPDHH